VKPKTLVVIAGVTGAIGSACLAKYGCLPDTTIIGISRQAIPASAYLSNAPCLPDGTLLCSIGNITTQTDCRAFAAMICRESYTEIAYVHALGIYPFELDVSGDVSVSHDDDGDGIDDRVVSLSYDAFFHMVGALSGLGLPVKALIFGGIADKHRPAVHRSWWTVMERVKARMRESVNAQIAFAVLNISSVLCPHELLTRPFVFTATDACPQFWLRPDEVADKTVTTLQGATGYVEVELFHRSLYYREGYYVDERFTLRKRTELGL
jgi:hypothetical protein